MNIIRNLVGVFLAITLFNIGVGQAHAAESTWSLDTFYQTINNINFVSDNYQPSVSSPAVTAQTSPAASVKTIAKTVAKKITVTATGYSSSVDETDDSPFITARGTYVHDGIIAANFLPFGTAVKIPAMFGDKVFVVEDRMNVRYSDRIDVWFPSKQAAFQFGLRKVTIEIVS